MQSIVYIMRHIDMGGHIDIPYKKIGITGAGDANLDTRLRQISNTKSPIKAQYVAAWGHGDAGKIETALHEILDDARVEGEWFLDLNDTLQNRIAPIMELLGAQELEIRETNDDKSKSILNRETANKEGKHNQLVGEIGQMLNKPLRSNNGKRQAGPTFFSDHTNLTYYVNVRKSGNHHLAVYKTKERFDDIKNLLEEAGFDVDREGNGEMKVISITNELVAKVINLVEAST